MEKIQFNYQAINEKEILEKIKANKEAKRLIDELEIPDELIVKQYVLFYNYLKENACCNNCKGKNDCKKYSKGYQYALAYDSLGLLTNSYKVCPYYQDYYAKKRNLVYTTFIEDEILDESQKNFVIDNANLLGMSFVSKIINILEGKGQGAFLTLKDSRMRLKLVKSLACGLLNKHKVAIIKFQDALNEIKEEFKMVTNEKVIDKLKNVEILIIDGLGNEAITSFSRDEVLLSLLDNRLQNNLVTILTSEYNLDDLSKIYKTNYQDGLKASFIIDKIKEIDRS